MTSLAFQELRGFLVDLDGVLFRGREEIPGARQFLHFLQESERPFVILTNNSTASPEEYVEKLRSISVTISADQVLTSSQVAASALAAAKDPCRAFVVGSPALRQALRESSVGIEEDYRLANAVVVGLDRQVDYERLARASLAVGRGARFVATNADLSFPSERGLEPGAGALVAVIQSASGVSPEVFGKPQAALFRAGLERLATAKSQTAMIGDRHETDIVGAHDFGLRCLAVATGAQSRQYHEKAWPRADCIFDSVRELTSRLQAPD